MRPIRHTLNQASNEVTFGDNNRDTETDLKYFTTKLKYFETKREKYSKNNNIKNDILKHILCNSE